MAESYILPDKSKINKNDQGEIYLHKSQTMRWVQKHVQQSKQQIIFLNPQEIEKQEQIIKIFADFIEYLNPTNLQSQLINEKQKKYQKNIKKQENDKQNTNKNKNIPYKQMLKMFQEIDIPITKEQLQSFFFKVNNQSVQKGIDLQTFIKAVLDKGANRYFADIINQIQEEKIYGKKQGNTQDNKNLNNIIESYLNKNQSKNYEIDIDKQFQNEDISPINKNESQNESMMDKDYIQQTKLMNQSQEINNFPLPITFQHTIALMNYQHYHGQNLKMVNQFLKDKKNEQNNSNNENTNLPQNNNNNNQKQKNSNTQNNQKPLQNKSGLEIVGNLQGLFKQNTQLSQTSLLEIQSRKKNPNISPYKDVIYQNKNIIDFNTEENEFKLNNILDHTDQNISEDFFIMTQRKGYWNRDITKLIQNAKKQGKQQADELFKKLIKYKRKQIKKLEKQNNNENVENNSNTNSDLKFKKLNISDTSGLTDLDRTYQITESLFFNRDNFMKKYYSNTDIKSPQEFSMTSTKFNKKLKPIDNKNFSKTQSQFGEGFRTSGNMFFKMKANQSQQQSQPSIINDLQQMHNRILSNMKDKKPFTVNKFKPIKGSGENVKKIQQEINNYKNTINNQNKEMQELFNITKTTFQPYTLNQENDNIGDYSNKILEKGSISSAFQVPDERQNFQSQNKLKQDIFKQKFKQMDAISPRTTHQSTSVPLSLMQTVSQFKNNKETLKNKYLHRPKIQMNKTAYNIGVRQSSENFYKQNNNNNQKKSSSLEKKENQQGLQITGIQSSTFLIDK